MSNSELHTQSSTELPSCNVSSPEKMPLHAASGHRSKYSDPCTQIVQSCLDRPLRVTLTDGRVVQGTLDCFDNSGNMILSAAADITSREARSKPIRLGTVLVPGNGSCQILASRPKQTVEDELVQATAVGLSVDGSAGDAQGE